jgi:hypothetical protein
MKEKSNGIIANSSSFDMIPFFFYNMYSIELLEGEDRPQQLGPTRKDSLGKTIGLMCRMCKPIFHIQKVAIIDSGFCISQGMIELKKVGVLLQH